MKLACLGGDARKALFSMLLIAALVESPAYAESCTGLLDDVTLVACADEELQGQVDSIRNVYEKLAEALGPRAAVNLSDDQSLWLKRVTENCGINGSVNLETVSTSGLDTARKFCLKRFAEVRVNDLNSRLRRAKTASFKFQMGNAPLQATDAT